MSTCRICLVSRAGKDVSELQTDVNEDNKTSFDIILFCLDIQISQDSKIGTKLCLKCYKKVLEFYKFKKLALKSDCYLNSVNKNCLDESKNEVYLREDNIKSEESSLCSQNLNSGEFECYIKVKNEVSVKEEDVFQGFQSDDELLSVIKQIKYENSIDESKENAPVIKKRGRPKKLIQKKKIEDKKDQMCEECGKTVRNLKEHLLQHQPFTDRKRIQCKVCDKTFTTYSARYKHHKIKHLGIKYHCEVCNKDVVSIRQHRLVVHNRAALPFSCVLCGRRFISQSLLVTHMLIHTKDRPYECDLCQKKFRTKITAQQHKRRVHDQEKTNLCQFCSKSFFKKYHLQVHLRSHTKEKPYECNECGKFFTSSTTLKNHKLIHNDVKMFGCTLCEMTFSKPGYLRNHMISHTKERRHSCKYCGVRFGRSDHRKRHERTAHERHLLTNT